MRNLLFAALAPLMVFAATRSFADDFDVTVSSTYEIPYYVQLAITQSSMDTGYFVQRNGGRTVYSTDVNIGRLNNGAPPPTTIAAHATWVISYNDATRTVTFAANATHITNWYQNQRCNVYEDGVCNCHNNVNWNFCQRPDMAVYVQTLTAAARIARINAALALRQAGYNTN